jgi:hypothetical protein
MYLRVSFGLMNVGATFQRAMDFAFRVLIQKIIEIYQDDLTVVSKDRKDHLSHLRIVFERCRKYGISLNPKKSVFGIDEGKLLGHMDSKGGVSIDPEDPINKRCPSPNQQKVLTILFRKDQFHSKICSKLCRKDKTHECFAKKGRCLQMG